MKMFFLTANLVMKKRGEDNVMERTKTNTEASTARRLDSWVSVEWMMNLYLSRAMMTMEKEEKKMQLAWMVLISLQMISDSGQSVSISMIVSGIVMVQKRMSEIARFVMNTFRGVCIT